MNIITGYRGEPHISAQQDRDYHMSTFGDGVYILNIGSKMVATVISANEVQVADGLIMAQGCLAEIAQGTVESLAISNGEQGMYRTDLIVLRYTKDSSTGVEDMALAVIEGTSASSSPETPAYTSGSIADGDVLVDFPLYEVNISGITIASITSLVDERTIATGESVSSLSTILTTVRSAVTTLTNKIGSTTMGTSATTITGAIKELLTKITTNTSNISTLTSKIGSTAMGTSATTVTAAIKELLTKINTHTTNISSATSRITALETKGQGISGTRQYTVAASGGKTYVPLQAVSTYVIIVNSYSTIDSLRGVYLIGSTSSKALGITTVKSASSVALADVDGGILRITNNGSIILRVTVITTSGTIPS